MPPSGPLDQRTPEQHAAVRRRALPVAVGGVLCAALGIVLAWTTPVTAFTPPSFLACNLSLCAMLIGVGIFLYAKPTPGTRAALILVAMALLLGMVGTMVYARQAVLSRLACEESETANVKAIADAAAAHAREHAGAYPADLLVLLEEKRITPQTLQSPLARAADEFNHFDALAKAATSRDQLLATVETKSDYIYLGGGLHTPPPELAGDIFVAVSNTTVARVSLALAFADGNVKFINRSQALEVMQTCNAARAKLGLGPVKPPPVIQALIDESKK